MSASTDRIAELTGSNAMHEWCEVGLASHLCSDRIEVPLRFRL
jgi:hypothetical protein